MAIIYVDDTKTGGGDDGTTKADAFLSLDNAGVDGAAAGSDIWVAHTHAESIGAATTLNFTASTVIAPVTVKSVDFSDDSYTPGAKLTITGAGNDITITGVHVQIYGVDFDAADAVFTNSGTDDVVLFEDLTITTGGVLSIGTPESKTDFINCTLTLGGSTAPFDTNAESEINVIRCTITHTSATDLVTESDNLRLVFEDCDLSANTTNITNGISVARRVSIIVRRCKMKASWTTLGAGSIVQPPTFILVEGCTDSTGLTVPEIGLTQLDTYYGTVTGVLTPDRTGGADDGENGPYSWKMVTNANATEQYGALESPPLLIWLDGSTTETGATSQGIYTSKRLAIQGTPGNLTTDATSTWNGSGVGTKQKITHTLSSQDGATLTVYVASGVTLQDDEFWIEVHEPDQVGGPLTVKCFLAKPSTTVYVDPKLEVV